MALIDNVRDRITTQYNADIEALKHSADIIAAHDRAAQFSGLTALVTVCYARTFVYLYAKENAMDYIRQYNGAYCGTIAGNPAFLCDVNGDSVFILGE